MSIAIKVENLSKAYQIGEIGTGTISQDLERWWITKVMGKEDPFLKIGETNDRSTKGESNVVWSLKDINFEIEQGDAVGIIGKNGAGKSTLLKLLSRVTAPTTGKIKIRGRAASLLEVGTGFHPELTGRENIYLNGSILGMRNREIDNKLDEIIDFSGVERYIDTPVKRYSSGMYVRLAFSVAAHLESEIMIVDEVLAVGDAEFQKKCIGKMDNISKKDGRTILFVSHTMAAVKSLCNKGIVLESGKVSFQGNQNEAVDSYLSFNKDIGTKSLKNRNDRIGNGDIMLKAISFFNKNNVEVSEIISGDYLKIQFSLTKNAYIDFSKLIVSVAFQDINQQTLLLFSSDEIGFDFSDLKKTDHFYLTIPKLLLRGNLYSLRVVLTHGTTNVSDFLDVIENAAQINVIEGDIWNSGKINRRLNQAIIPAEYKILV